MELEDEIGKSLDNPRKAAQRNIDGSYVLECLPMNSDKKIKIATRELPDVQNVLEFQVSLR